MSIPIGDILVQKGVISNDQKELILSHQKQSGRPFGDLAEQLFGVPSRQVEEAWADQYAAITRRVDPVTERIDPAALALITRRQAWQFKLLPLRYEGRELIVATTAAHLVRAHNFAMRHVAAQCCFVIAEPEALGTAMQRHYPMAGMTIRSITEGEATPGSGQAAA